MVVAPVYELLPDNPNVPAPVLVIAPAPLITPPYVEVFPVSVVKLT